MKCEDCKYFRQPAKLEPCISCKHRQLYDCFEPIEKSAFQEWNDSCDHWPVSGYESRKQGWNAAIDAAGTVCFYLPGEPDRELLKEVEELKEP
jgi:hypothetical protein